MSENAQSAMLEILKRIQSDVSGLRSDVSGLRSDVSVLKSDIPKVTSRLERVEDLVKRQRRDSAALLVMMRGTVGVFNERMDTLEVEMAALKEGR
jgi:predicted  nucleic acid-binding Zn-ribbon protein